MRRAFVWFAVIALAHCNLVSAQEPTPAAQPKPTLPPVEVTPMPTAPPDIDYGNNNFGNDTGLRDLYGNRAIPWDSDEVQSDSQRVGAYNQPVWTSQRPYASTRAYVLPPGTVQFEQWCRPTYKKGKKPEYRMLDEIAIGLPHHFQLDIYERWNIEPDAGNNEKAHHEGVQLELRWALGDWGDYPLNPTFYGEWIERGGPQDKPNKYELKLLLADELNDCLFFASNLILEQEIEDERETELGVSLALSTPIIERKLMAGVEMVLSSTTVQGARDANEVSFLIGPSLQLRPTNRTFLDVVSLFGTTVHSPQAQLYFIFGYQFGSRAAPSESISGPASTRGN